MIYLVSPSERTFLRDAGDRMPLGNLYLSTALRDNGIEHKLVDLNHTEEDDFIEDVRLNKPYMVGLSVMSPTFQMMRELAGRIRLNSPKTRIVAGGFHVTSLPRTMGGCEEIWGYGEDALVNKITDGPYQSFDINRYPIPNRNILDKNQYEYKLEGMVATTMITSRGCPFSCSFCGNFDKKTKFRGLDNIDEELKQIKAQGYKAVYLVDDSFTIDRKQAESIGGLMKKHGLKYRIEGNTNFMDNDMADILKDTGCVMVAFGIESGDNDVLIANRKPGRTQHAEEAIKLMHDNGIKSKGFFMFGMPYESPVSAQRTIDFAKHLKNLGLNYADFYVMAPFPGTPIYRDPSKFGVKILEPDYTKYLSASIERPKCYIHNGLMSPVEIEGFRNRAQEAWEYG